MTVYVVRLPNLDCQRLDSAKKRLPNVIYNNLLLVSSSFPSVALYSNLSGRNAEINFTHIGSDKIKYVLLKTLVANVL